MRLGFLSDVEARWSKLEDFCEDNPWVSLRGTPSGPRLDVQPGATFVYGGDTLDRGPHSRRVLLTLVEAKVRQPDRVILLAGNRDINKLRLPRELSGHPRTGAPTTSRADILRWTLARTMGAAGAFMHRAAELGVHPEREEEQVVQSMLDDIAPGGALYNYLTLAQLAYRCEETLFVHGGVTEENLGALPEEPDHVGPDHVGPDHVGPDHVGPDHVGPDHAGPLASTTDEWVAALNRFYAGQLQCYARDPGGTAHNMLIRYQAPLPGTRANPRSVVYARPVDAAGNAATPSPALRARLGASGVRRTVVGHTPAGDSPGIIRVGGFEAIIADSSYGRLERGSQVLLDGPRTTIRAWVQLDGGPPQRLSCDLELDTPSPIGRRDVASGQVVKGQLDDGRYLLCRFLPDFRAEEVAVEDLRGRVFEGD